jgi:hypothetical protein
MGLNGRRLGYEDSVLMKRVSLSQEWVCYKWVKPPIALSHSLILMMPYYHVAGRDIPHATLWS